MRRKRDWWDYLVLAWVTALYLYFSWWLMTAAHGQTGDPYMDGLRDRLMSITMDQCDQEVKLLGLYGVATTDASWYECVSHYTAETGRRILAGDGFVETPWRGVVEMRKREAQ